ncbi:hypothetical protein HMPREF0972_02355 [Actinomyces sp. oral taxon 848 str. F0332]|nr:hypothetical protein HMPREF0972_02355 [Actinomyces sp. oral taxon 848 str. F0332]
MMTASTACNNGLEAHRCCRFATTGGPAHILSDDGRFLCFTNEIYRTNS